MLNNIACRYCYNELAAGADSITFGAAISYEVFKNFTVSPYLGGDLSDSRPKGTDSALPSVEAQFPLSELDGFDLWVDYLVYGVRVFPP
jgi:hypothetical protein